MDVTEICDTSIDLNALRVFMIVAEVASFSAAARKLGLTKWSVSRTVSSLEASMGIPLLHRTTRHVALSPEGADLLERIAPLLSSLNHATRAIQEKLEKPAGKVYLTIPNLFYTAHIGNALSKFAAQYPDVQIYVHITDSAVNFAIEGFDIALWLAPERMKDSSLVARRGWRFVGQYCASPAYIARHGYPATLADLANHEQVVLVDYNSVPLQDTDAPLTVKANSRLVSNDIYFVREAVLSGAGIGLLPNFFIREDIAKGSLISVLPHYQSSDVYAYIIRPSTREVPLRVKVLSDFLFEYMKDNPL